MTDRPLIFSAPMVLALLAGRKMQTRRLCAWANNPNSPALTYIVACDEPSWFGDEEGEVRFRAGYAPGDRLWVKEAWRAPKVVDHLSPRNLSWRDDRIWYEADRDNCDAHGRLRSSRFMPRWASRLTLLVTDVRVERVQSISEADAAAEGAEAVDLQFDHRLSNAHRIDLGGLTSHVLGYERLWNSIHGPDAWEANPWVVAVTFNVQHGNIDA